MPTKRIILMYISEVSGHHSATLAIEKALKILSPATEILNINAFNYTNPISEKIINQLYMGVIKRTPKLWEYLYDNPKVIKKIESLKESVHKYNTPKLKNLFDEFRPDAVVCTQAFPCGMTADFKRAYNSRLPLVAVLTDYVPHSYWIYADVDYYIVPSDEVYLRLQKKGVEPAKIKIFGIPFDPKFNQEAPRQEILRKLNLREGVFTILLMGGGQGLGPIKKIVKSLEKVNGPLREIIVTGTNKKLYNSLNNRLKKYKKNILVFGYVDNISELMSVSDAIITKPGGVTTAEALAKGLPMIIAKPIPGQEANNAAYLTKKKAAIKIDEPEEVCSVIEDLLNEPGRLKELKASVKAISKPDAAIDIARLLLNIPNV